MKRIILALTFLTLLNQACAPNDASSEKTPPVPVVALDPENPSGPPIITPPQPKYDCSADSLCKSMCNITFQFTTIRAIERAAAAAGTLQSGATLKKISDNFVSIANNITCLNSSTTDANDLMKNPLTLDEMFGFRVPDEGIEYCYQGNYVWQKCN